MQKSSQKNNSIIVGLVISAILISVSSIIIILSLINIVIFSTYRIEINQPVEKLSSKQSIYENYPTKGDYIGTITMPTLKETLPIYEGTSSDELKKGVGHFIQSVLPGELDNTVISGHRDTAFKNVGNLKLADIVIVKTRAGEFVYKITAIKIVEKNDKTVIVSTKEPMLTMTTCYPFNYIGFAPKRYIVSAILIKK